MGTVAGMDVSLAEELLLLGYNDETGRAEVGSPQLDCGLAGAVLVELALAGRVEVIDGKLTVLAPAPVGDVEADAALGRITGEGKERKPEWWVGKLRSGIRDRLLDRLTDRGVQQQRRQKVLGLFPVRRYPTVDSAPEAATRARLELVVAQGRRADARTAALASLLDACGLARRTFPDLDRGQLKARMHQLNEGQWTSAAVRKAIQWIQAGVMAATTAGGAAACGTSSC